MTKKRTTFTKETLYNRMHEKREQLISKFEKQHQSVLYENVEQNMYHILQSIYSWDVVVKILAKNKLLKEIKVRVKDDNDNPLVSALALDKYFYYMDIKMSINTITRTLSALHKYFKYYNIKDAVWDRQYYQRKGWIYTPTNTFFRLPNVLSWLFVIRELKRYEKELEPLIESNTWLKQKDANKKFKSLVELNKTFKSIKPKEKGMNDKTIQKELTALSSEMKLLSNTMNTIEKCLDTMSKTVSAKSCNVSKLTKALPKGAKLVLPPNTVLDF